MAVTTRFQSAGVSDPGRKRHNNEDRFHADPDRGIFLVVDGMGGQAAGETAAGIAVDMIRTRLERVTGSPTERLREAIAVANNAIFEAAQEKPEWRGMACVLTAAVVEDDRVTIGHVGDSRLYLLRPGEIRKVTPDHSPVGELEDSAQVSEAEAMRHPRRNEVFRDVGSARHAPDDPNFIEILTIPFTPQSALLLCSDGLSDLLESASIRDTIEANAGRPGAAVQALIDAANRAGGKDNITAVLVTGPEYAPQVEPTGLRRAIQAPRRNFNFLSFFAGRVAMLLYGLAIGFALHYLLATPPPRVTPSSGPRTWMVGQTDAADTTTISDALVRAKPGDTIVAEPGTYHEALLLREGVTLRSKEPFGAILESELNSPPGTQISAAGIHHAILEGFRIAGNNEHPIGIGIEVKDSSVDLVRLQITGAKVAGISISGSSKGSVEASRIAGNFGTGIVVSGTASPAIEGNLIVENGRVDAKPGLEVRSAAVPQLSSNVFSGNGAEAIWIPSTSSSATAYTTNNYFVPPDHGPAKKKIKILPQGSAG